MIMKGGIIMADWWEGLTTLQQVLYCIAIPATLVMLIQTILILVGVGSGGGGVDFSDTSGLDFSEFGDMPSPADADLSGIGDGSAPGDIAAGNIFTFQGVVVFLAMFGWVTIAAISLGLDKSLSFVAIIIGITIGFLCMIGIAKLIFLSTKLNQNGTLIMSNLLGTTGSVYLTVPEKGKGQGKINITIEERYLELNAVTDEEAPLTTGSEIRVIDIRGDILVVESTN